ncbi:MAG: S8 family serine peptidase [Pseudolabrys sp.]
MREFAKAAVLAAAIMLGALSPAFSQATNAPPPVINRGVPITPLGGYVIGSIARAAVSPMIATVILGRGLTISEAYHTTLGCMLGPVGWLLADAMFPPTVAVTNTRQPTPPRKPKRTTSGGNVNIPPSGETRFIANEIQLRFAAGTSERSRSLVVGQLNLTLLESQTFELTGQTIGRYRIDGGQSAVQTLRLIARDFPGVNAAQVNFVYVGAQVQQPARQDPPAGDASAQYVVRKLHLLEAHRVNKGDDVLVAVVDSKIDNDHPGLAGVIGGEFDAVGTPTFAGPADPMLREMLARAGARGIVLVAVVGNAGPNSPPLYPGADAGVIGVIGVTATDANDKLMPQANRGPQVAVAAPGVEILAAAPDGKYQVTSGTSVAAAHVSGVAALLLATKPKLTPAQVRGNLVRSAHRIPGTRNEVGAGVVDALAVVNPGSK